MISIPMTLFLSSERGKFIKSMPKWLMTRGLARSSTHSSSSVLHWVAHYVSQWVQIVEWLLVIFFKFRLLIVNWNFHFITDKLVIIKASDFEDCQSMQGFLKKAIKLRIHFMLGKSHSHHAMIVIQLFLKMEIWISI